MDNAHVLSQIGPDDLFMAVMGITGSGKSTFISKLTDAEVEIGHGLESHTKVIQAYPYEHHGRRVWLVDTPGFDDTVRPDIDVLEDLAYWLMVAANKKFKLAGIVHLHRITDTRMGGAAYKDLKMFQKFCGQESFPSVVLATTMWPESPTREDIGREQQLRTKFYQNMIDDGRGAKMVRHMNTRDSAATIVSYLVGQREGRRRSQPLVLAIQRELAGEGATLLDTGAGRELEAEKIKIRESFEQKLKGNERRLDRAIKKKDQELVTMRLQQQEVLKKMLAEAQTREDETRTRLKAEMKEQFAEKEKLLKQLQEKLEKMEIDKCSDRDESRDSIRGGGGRSRGSCSIEGSIYPQADGYPQQNTDDGSGSNVELAMGMGVASGLVGLHLAAAGICTVM